MATLITVTGERFQIKETYDEINKMIYSRERIKSNVIELNTYTLRTDFTTYQYIPTTFIISNIIAYC